MVGPLQSPAASNSIPISRPSDDAKHSANFIKTGSEVIDGHHTDFMVQPFADRIFILVTQLEKMGTMIAAEKESAIGGAQAYSVTVLMGKRDVPELELCARQVLAVMENDGCTKPLLLSIALKDHSIGTVKAVIEKIKGLRAW